MSTDSDTTAEPAAAGWTRPELPPEGAKNLLDEHPFDLVQTPLPAGIVVEQVRIPMRDAVELAATVFRPVGGDAVPAIATATPYGKDNYQQWHNFRDAPEGNVPGGGFYLGHVEVSDHTAFEAPDPGYWVPNGYAVVLVDLLRPRRVRLQYREVTRTGSALVGHAGLAGRAALVHRQRRDERGLGALRDAVDRRQGPGPAAAEGDHPVGGQPSPRCCALRARPCRADHRRTRCPAPCTGCCGPGHGLGWSATSQWARADPRVDALGGPGRSKRTASETGCAPLPADMNRRPLQY